MSWSTTAMALGTLFRMASRNCCCRRLSWWLCSTRARARCCSTRSRCPRRCSRRVNAAKVTVSNAAPRWVRSIPCSRRAGATGPSTASTNSRKECRSPARALTAAATSPVRTSSRSARCTRSSCWMCTAAPPPQASPRMVMVQRRAGRTVSGDGALRARSHTTPRASAAAVTTPAQTRREVWEAPVHSRSSVTARTASVAASDVGCSAMKRRASARETPGPGAAASGVAVEANDRSGRCMLYTSELTSFPPAPQPQGAPEGHAGGLPCLPGRP